MKCGRCTDGCRAHKDSAVQVLTDDDISTKFHWTRPHALSSESRAEIMWTVPEGTPAGSYRCPLRSGSCCTTEHSRAVCNTAVVY